VSDPKGDPRREPDEKPPVVTGVRRTVVRKNLDLIAPLPSIPPAERRDEPDMLLKFMYQIADSHRDAAAFIQARAEESWEEIKGELDDVRASVLVVDGKISTLDNRLGRLEDRVGTIVNAQIVQGAQITELQKGQARQEATFTGALTNVHTRIDNVVRDVAANRSEIDSLRVTFAQFRELIMADVDVRRKQLALEEAKNGGPPDTPKVKRDDSGDTGSED
jgi:hypothetical protein